MAKTRKIQNLLNARRSRLGLSCAALARRAGVSLRTVQRVLSGEETDPGFSTILWLSEALGVSLRLDEEDAEAFRRQQAARKADQLVGMVQSTSALEAQAVSQDTVRELRERTINELLAGSNRKLWAA